MPIDNELDWSDEQLSKLKRGDASETDNESPFKQGECLCGVPNCRGHLAKDGQFEIDHPTQGKIVVKV